jgi:hypothetical protein
MPTLYQKILDNQTYINNQIYINNQDSINENKSLTQLKYDFIQNLFKDKEYENLTYDTLKIFLLAHQEFSDYLTILDMIEINKLQQQHYLNNNNNETINCSCQHLNRDREKNEIYKQHVKEFYNNICPITQQTINLEVAHIKDFALCENDEERYDPSNGILLDQRIHSLWDKKILKLTYDNFDNYENYFFQININYANIAEILNNVNNLKMLAEIINKKFVINNESGRVIEYVNFKNRLL